MAKLPILGATIFIDRVLALAFGGSPPGDEGMTTSPRAVPSAVNGWSAEYLDDQYTKFKADPGSLEPDLQAFFQGFDLAQAHRAKKGAQGVGDAQQIGEALRVQSAASGLIDSYRRRGHLAARTDPFGREPERSTALSLSHHGLSESDLDEPVSTGSLPLDAVLPLRQVIDFLERVYCGPIGAQFMHVSDDEERDWLAERFERFGGASTLTRGERVHVLEQLLASEQLERFVGKRYPTEKRFSLEGGEALIPLLDRVIEALSELGAEELVMGMPHRGRLNVLNNILGKTYEQIFTEFEDNWEEDFADGGGDVKYHKGYSGTRELRNGKTVHLALASNPSHLESVGGVVEGRCRAKQRLRGDTDRKRVIPVLIHGDAAVIGQGVVAEVLNFSQIEGYATGGTIHVVINNLIGFTTGQEDARTSKYCTDVGLMIEAPSFHVNGEDPEAVVEVAQIAAEYRQRFQKDVFIDMVCFRKYGHNEQDEPSFTQPLLARLIKDRKGAGVLGNYAEKLLADGVLTDDDMKLIQQRLLDSLEQAQQAAREKPHDPTIDPGSKRWDGYDGAYSFEPVDTGVSEETLRTICDALGRVPEGFNLNPKLKKLLGERSKIVDTGRVNHADAELLAFGTLLLEGHALRLSGQDSRRGTFSQRHAVLRDFETGDRYNSLNAMRPIAPLPDEAGRPNEDGEVTQGRFCLYDSPLSEFSVLGFEYGYSLADPRMLVMWEAQFGDFNNGAQVMIDQYLASAEIKWDRWSGLVLLLPHGYEGAGPEHSSARLERFLLLCANDNMEVVYPSTAAQTFHMYRRELRRKFRKPLVVMTPKSMLRVPTSDVDDLINGRFRELIDDPAFTPVGDEPAGGTQDRSKVKRVALCSGKIYHELAARRDLIGREDVAIVRVEQLYPFYTRGMQELLARYPDDAEVAWVQEEPRNMGAFLYMADALQNQVGVDRVWYFGRDASATPAVGSKSKHKQEQESIITHAIGPKPDNDAPAKNGTPTNKTNPRPEAKKASASASA